jgi:hypothetical protein
VSDEEHSDPLAAQPLRHHGAVRVRDVFLRRLLALLARGELRAEIVALVPEVVDLVLQLPPLGLVDEAASGDPDSDEDPDDERDEDRRKRHDVVAEGEH